MYAAPPTSSLSSQQQRLVARGFTTIELMVVVAIITILAALAAPSFRPLIERWRVRAATEDLQSILYYARSEAIKRGGKIVLKKIASGNGCTAADANTQWGCGWTVFIDANNNATQDSGELTLQTSSAPTKLEINLASSNGYITVDRWGQLASAGSSSFNFRLFPQGSNATNSAAATLCVAAGGMIRRLNTGDGTC
ncbi:GspH/FimT family pseudopilin [Delftia acidovorans]|uniref:GspH/FimT family pseudopilin n=1 Tax=Delftia acidovorans TaxID=80866 RepID=UPI00192C5646|nr:GspH/FimT family pseudopilin [Delftia acidovorans]